MLEEQLVVLRVRVRVCACHHTIDALFWTPGFASASVRWWARAAAAVTRRWNSGRLLTSRICGLHPSIFVAICSRLRLRASTTGDTPPPDLSSPADVSGVVIVSRGQRHVVAVDDEGWQLGVVAMGCSDDDKVMLSSAGKTTALTPDARGGCVVTHAMVALFGCPHDRLNGMLSCDGGHITIKLVVSGCRANRELQMFVLRGARIRRIAK
jgi:hypothetical protein